ncbi:MAG TPA: hypothetical protein VMS71_00385 [Candidatus Acidoferrum sp.]|nr:hypothetical protein [Candidatus Acidoferrum sp.]
MSGKSHLTHDLILFVGVSLVVATALAAADEDYNKSKVGISASLQGSQTDIQLPIWADKKVVFVPSFGFTSVSGAVTDVRFGFMFRYNLRFGRLVPYNGIRFGVLRTKPQGGDAIVDQLLGVAVGGEYFFDRHFSAGVEAQLNAAFSDDNSTRFGNPGGTNINTATAANVTFYF